jgi:uncharacterized protein
MTDPVPSPSLSPEEKTRTTQAAPASADPPTGLSPELAAARTWAERIFEGPEGLRIGWRVLLYLVATVAVIYILMWLGTSLFAQRVHGATRLWQSLYVEVAFAAGAIAPMFLMARIERRPVDEYGLQRSQAFGRLFWMGVLWGLGAITFLLLVMRGTHVFYFGHVLLHGGRVLKFALFWAVFFLLVALFEESLTRGYLLFTLQQPMGFWPAAVVLSCGFGAIHLFNPGEEPIGIAAAVAIGFFFCLTLRRTGSLWFAVGFHAAWDWGQSYLWGVADSGSIATGRLFEPSIADHPAWLTGGSVGPEGSVLCLLLIAVLWVAFVWKYRARRERDVMRADSA